MFACETCGVTAAPDSPTLPKPPSNRLLLEGPTTHAELDGAEWDWDLRKIHPTCARLLACWRWHSDSTKISTSASP